MATFMEGCKCKGTRPAGIVGRRFTSRPEIIGRLLRDRNVARFIVAPAGFGKSTVSFEYANIIFGFEGVFWINAKSPCFLRDLDADNLLEPLLRADPNPKLVVCDDVPCLDDVRSQVFNEFIDALLNNDCEVLVTCRPASDTFSHLQRSRIVLCGAELLLSDEELAVATLSGRLSESEARSIVPSQRIACLQWGENGVKQILAGVAAEDLSADIRLSMFLMLLFEKGLADDLNSVLAPDRAKEAAKFLDSNYPFLGQDLRAGTFDAISVSLKDLSGAFCQHIQEMADASVHAGSEEMLGCIAENLLKRNEANRACEFIGLFAQKPVAAAWLARRGLAVLDKCEPLGFLLLYDLVRRSASGNLDALSMYRVVAAIQIADYKQASNYARRVVRSATSSEIHKAAASAFLLMLSGGAEQSRAYVKLKSFAEQSENSPEIEMKETFAAVEADEVAQALNVLVNVGIGFNEGLGAAAKVWFACLEDLTDAAGVADAAGAANVTSAADEALSPVKKNSLLLCAALILLAMLAKPDSLSPVHALLPEKSDTDADAEISTGATFQSIVSAICGLCSQAAEEASANEECDWVALFAGVILEDACSRWDVLTPWLPSRAASASITRMRLRMAEQREKYCIHVEQVNETKREYRRTHPDVFRRGGASDSTLAASASIPMLTVDLFGGMEVYLGDEMLDPRLLSRAKSKTLLAMLVIQRGREIQRERIAQILWPDSSTTAYRRNFYSIWSQLRKALSINGSCPYLIRSQTGCSLDARFIKSDVYDYEELCRSLLFGNSESEDWERIYTSVCVDYSEQLMPYETQNPTIMSLRQHYHTQMVDGLLATSSRLNASGDYRGALWFAREALRRETKREDVYTVLMEAQIASDQRAAALETYFACRRFLSEELGIDPSIHLVELYRSIIEIEEPF